MCTHNKWGAEPEYYILTLVYAPPGCGDATHGCSNTNSVDYSTLSSTGTTTTMEQSSGSGLTITASVGPKGNTVGGGFTSSTTSTNSSALTITRTQTGDVKVIGAEDGINHERDQFRILLNPTIVTASVGNSVAWSMGWRVLPGFTPALTGPLYVDVFVSELRNNAANMRSQIKQYFTALNFTKADYDTILSQDPYASSSPKTPPSPRYAPTTFSNIQYAPPLQLSTCTNNLCPCDVYGGALSNDLQQQTVVSSQSKYEVSVTTTGSIPDVASLTVGANMTWSNTSTTSHVNKGTETATVSVSCPSIYYPKTASGSLSIYWDTLYGSFLFVPLELTNQVIISQGSVVQAGMPVRHQAVTLTVGDTTYHTTTDNNGEYAFYSGVITPNAEHHLAADFSVGGVHKTLAIGATAKTAIDLTGH